MTSRIRIGAIGSGLGIEFAASVAAGAIPSRKVAAFVGAIVGSSLAIGLGTLSLSIEIGEEFARIFPDPYFLVDDSVSVGLSLGLLAFTGAVPGVVGAIAADRVREKPNHA